MTPKMKQILHLESVSSLDTFDQMGSVGVWGLLVWVMAAPHLATNC